MMGIHDLLGLIVLVFDVFGKITYFSLVISSIVGQFIVKFALIISTSICTVFLTLFDVMKVLYEDYFIFLHDVMNKGACIIEIIRSMINWIVNTVCSWWITARNICMGIYDFLILTMDSIYAIVTKTMYFISCIPEVLKNCFTLVGSGIWLALKLIPLGLVYIISMFVFLIGRSCEEVMSFVESALKGITSIFYGVMQFFYDIPLEAQAGLLLGLCIVYASMKYHTLIIYCFIYLQNRLKYALHWLWSGLERLLLAMFTNQNRGIQYEEPHESDESVDDDSVNSQVQDDSSSSNNSMLSLRSRVVSRMDQRRSNTKRGLLNQLEQEQENKLCVVCQDRNKCVIILPCRHLCLCTECCTVIQQDHGLCPICRQYVRRTMKIYV